MVRLSSPPFGEDCGCRNARSRPSDHSHPLTRQGAKLFSSSSGPRSLPFQCRNETLARDLTTRPDAVLECTQHLVKHSRARLTGDARSAKPTNIEGRGDDTSVFVISGLRASCLKPEPKPTARTAYPGPDYRHRALARPLESLALTRDAGVQWAGHLFLLRPFDHHGENMKKSRGFRSLVITPNSARWLNAGDVRQANGSTTKPESSVALCRAKTGSASEARSRCESSGTREYQAANGTV